MYYPDNYIQLQNGQVKKISRAFLGNDTNTYEVISPSGQLSFIQEEEIACESTPFIQEPSFIKRIAYTLKKTEEAKSEINELYNFMKEKLNGSDTDLKAIEQEKEKLELCLTTLSWLKTKYGD